MKVAIVGSRHYADLSAVGVVVGMLDPGTEVVSGDAEGVDRTAKNAAATRHLPYRGFPPDRARYGAPAAFHIRNRALVEYADQVIAFWDEQSSGTRSVIDLARRAGKLHAVYGRGARPIPREELGRE